MSFSPRRSGVLLLPLIVLAAVLTGCAKSNPAPRPTTTVAQPCPSPSRTKAPDWGDDNRNIRLAAIKPQAGRVPKGETAQQFSEEVLGGLIGMWYEPRRCKQIVTNAVIIYGEFACPRKGDGGPDTIKPDMAWVEVCEYKDLVAIPGEWLGTTLRTSRMTAYAAILKEFTRYLVFKTGEANNQNSQAACFAVTYANRVGLPPAYRQSFATEIGDPGQANVTATDFAACLKG